MRWPSIQVGLQPVPFALADKHLGALGQPARHREDERHGHVGGVLGQDARRIGHSDAALERGRHVDMIDAVAEIGDQLQAFARMAEYRPVDLVGHCRHHDVGDFGDLGEVRRAHRLVVDIEADVEQLAHARFDGVRQLAGDHHQRLLARCHSLPLTRPLDDLPEAVNGLLRSGLFNRPRRH